MVEIDKRNKPESFQELYQRANPIPGVRAKVPLIVQQQQQQQQVKKSSSEKEEGEEEEETIILCESTVISEYLATANFQNKNQNQQDVEEEDDDDDKFWPTNPKERARLRLFMELCDSSFSSYVAFTRVQNQQQIETQYDILKERMKQVDSFLSKSSFFCGVNNNNNRPSFIFTMADAHLAPFVQRCCKILPPPYDPISIANDLELTTHLKPWIEFVLNRESVKITSPPLEEIENKKQKLIKRLARISKQQQQQQQ